MRNYLSFLPSSQNRSMRFDVNGVYLLALVSWLWIAHKICSSSLRLFTFQLAMLLYGSNEPTDRTEIASRHHFDDGSWMGKSTSWHGYIQSTKCDRATLSNTSSFQSVFNVCACVCVLTLSWIRNVLMKLLIQHRKFHKIYSFCFANERNRIISWLNVSNVLCNILYKL